MDFFNVSDLNKLKVLFSALNKVNLNLNLIPPVLNGIKKAEFLDLLGRFPDLKDKDEKEVAEYLKSPANIQRVLGRLSQTQGIRVEEFLQEKPAVEAVPEQAGEQTGKQETPIQQQVPQQPSPMVTGMGPRIPTMPHMPSISTAPRIRMERTPEAAEETAGEKLYVANKGGHVIEERTVSPSGTTIKNPEPSSIGGKSGLVTANKSGIVSEGFKGEKLIAIANKSGQVIGEKLVKDLESKGQIGASKGIRAIGRGFGSILGGVGRGVLGLLGGAAGGGRLVVRGGLGAVDALGRGSYQISRGGGVLKRKGIPKKFWLLLLGFFLLAGIIGGLAGSSPITPPGGGTGPQNQISISKSPIDHVDIGQEIPYTITVTYTGTGTPNVTVTDKLDKQVSFRSASDNGTPQGDTVTWTLPNLPSNTPKLLTLNVTPAVPKDSPGIWVVNQAQATITSTSGGAGGGSASTSCPKCQHDPPAFVQLMTGNGRKNLFSDADSFAKTVETNGSNNHLSLSSAQDIQVRSVYKKATDAKVNPLAVLVIWGVENGFSTDDSIPNFGVVGKDIKGNQICPNGFNSQLGCAVTSLNNYMNDFANGQTSFPQTDCTYTDGFLYAYEWYTPICHEFDNNLNARSRFVELYNKLGGQ